VGDSCDGEGRDADGVALVAAEAPDASAVEVMEEADVIAAWAGHDDGVALLPVLGALEADGLPPGGPGSGTEVVGRHASRGLVADVATETATPGGLAVVTVEPVSSFFDPCGDLRIGFGTRDFTGAEVVEGGSEDAGTGGHRRGLIR